MAIYDQTRLGELYKLINRDNPSAGMPFTTENSTVEGVVALSTGPLNSAATLVGKRYSGYRGKKTFKYNRIDLSTYCKNIEVTVTATPETPKDLDSMLPFLNSALGIYLEVGDYPNEPLKANSTTLLFEGTIKINPGHPIYIGNLFFRVSGYTVDLETLVTIRDVNAMTDPAPHVGGKFNATMLTYGHDYTELQQLWTGWVPGVFTPGVAQSDAEMRKLAVYLNTIDGLPWVMSAKAAPFNLKGAQILYDGPPIASWAGSVNNPEPNKLYDRVLILQPNATYCSNIANGNGWGMLFHYDLIEG